MFGCFSSGTTESKVLTTCSIFPHCFGSYPDKTVSSASSNWLEGLLCRVEGLLEQLLDQTESGLSVQSPAQSTSVTLEDGVKCQPEVVSSTTHTVVSLLIHRN